MHPSRLECLLPARTFGNFRDAESVYLSLCYTERLNQYICGWPHHQGLVKPMGSVSYTDHSGFPVSSISPILHIVGLGPAGC